MPAAVGAGASRARGFARQTLVKPDQYNWRARARPTKITESLHEASAKR